MRIVLIGQAAFAEKVLEALIKQGEEIAHVFAPPDAPGGRLDPLKTRALELGLPLDQPVSFRDQAIYERFKSLGADLAILAFVTVIVPERILYASRLKSLCFHPSLLPRHRGASAINWAIIEGDPKTGITWFWPDRGIDTGPILLQREVPIAENDTAGSLYFNRLFPLGIETVIEAVDLIREGRAPAVAQDERYATYEPPCGDEHARVDFSMPAQRVYNLVRGCDPQPGAWAQALGRRLRLYEAALGRGACAAEPGTVLGIDEAGMRVALEGGTLLVRRVRLDPEPKKAAPQELLSSNRLREGIKLG